MLSNEEKKNRSPVDIVVACLEDLVALLQDIKAILQAIEANTRKP